MACNKFELIGLPYLYGELGQDEARSYELHMAECAECSQEVTDCRSDRESFYTASILGDDPRPSVDAEILRVCANPAKVVTSAFAPMMFIKKYAAVPIFIMLIMVAIGGYVSYHSMNAQDLRAELINDASPDPANSGDTAGLARTDSLRDDVPRPKGNLDMDGVVPVRGD